MVQGFELRDLQFEAGSINDNYRVFILPCCKIVHSSLEIGLEELHFYGTILGGSPYSNSLSFLAGTLLCSVDSEWASLTTGWGYGCP